MADTLFDIGDKLTKAARNVHQNVWPDEESLIRDVGTVGNVIKSLSGIVIESAYYDPDSYTWKITVDGPDDVFANLLRLASVIP